MERPGFIQNNEDTNDNNHWKDPAFNAGKDRRAHWEKQFKEIVAAGEKPGKDLFDGLENDFDKNEWTW